MLFANESLSGRGICRQCGCEHFDGDLAIQPWIAGLENDPHPAMSENLNDLILFQIAQSSAVTGRR
jgi:hypothetical protein